MKKNTAGAPPEDLLVPAVGAVIFASDEPVASREIAEVLGGVERKVVEQAIDELQNQFESIPCGLRIERVAGGIRLATRTDVGEWVRRFFQQRNRTRLSPAALETLAIVAYRQPITAPEIQAIRAKDPTAALKGLLDKKLMRVLGRKKVVGSPILYGTTKQFLMHFGLNGLNDLPSIEEFDQFLGVLEHAQASVVFEPMPGDESDEDPGKPTRPTEATSAAAPEAEAQGDA